MTFTCSRGLSTRCCLGSGHGENADEGTGAWQPCAPCSPAPLLPSSSFCQPWLLSVINLSSGWGTRHPCLSLFVTAVTDAVRHRALPGVGALHAQSGHLQAPPHLPGFCAYLSFLKNGCMVSLGCPSTRWILSPVQLLLGKESRAASSLSQCLRSGCVPLHLITGLDSPKTCGPGVPPCSACS